MAFDAGELVLTMRGQMSPLTRDLAKLRTDLAATGTAGDAAGKAVEQAGAKGAAGTKKATAASNEAAAAARNAAAAQRAAAAATGAAATAEGRSTSANREAAKAATAAGAAAQRQARATSDAGDATQAAGETAQDAAKRTEATLERTTAAGSKLGAGITAYGVAAVSAFGLAVHASTEFGSRMAQVQTLSGANEDQMHSLSEAALTMGQAYGLSANQTADAEIELQKAGQGVAAQLGGGLKGALVLAAAGQMDVADATSIAVTTMTQFQLGAEKTEHVADLLAAGSDKALGSVKDLGDGMAQSGLVAAQMGLSVEDTVGTLSEFAQAGLKGSDGGTSFKTMLLSLQSPSTQAQKQLDRLGISAYDAQGKFVGITNLSGQLHDKLQEQTQAQRDAALSTIFGSDAIRAANILYTDGAAGNAKWIKSVDDAGFAAKQAAGKQDSLAGALAKLAAAINTDLIRAGNAVEPALRPAVDVLTTLAGVAGHIPAPLLGIAAGFAGVSGAVALGMGGLLLFGPKLLEIRTAARVMRQELALATYGTGGFSSAARVGTTAASGFRSGLKGVAGFLGGPWGIALAVGAAALIAYEAAVEKAKASTDVLDAAAKNTSKGVDQLIASAAQGQNVQSGIFAWMAGQDSNVEKGVLDDLSSKLKEIAAIDANPLKGFLEGSPQLGATERTLTTVGETLSRLASSDGPAAARAFEQVAAKTDGSQSSLRALLSAMGPYEQALRAAAIAQGLNVTSGSKAEQQNRLLAFALKQTKVGADAAATGASSASGGIDDVAESAADAQKKVDDLADSLKSLDGGQLDARQAARQFQAAIDDATASLKDNGRTVVDHGTKLDISTEKGRNNAEALDAIASAGLDAASAYVHAGGDAAGAARKIGTARDAFVKAAGPDGMGLTKKAAEQLADKLGLIPSHVPIDVSVTGNPEAEIAHIKELINGVPRYFYVDARIRSGAVTPGAPASIAAPHKAGGGDLDAAPGAKGVDSMMFVGAKGEHVFTAKDVDAMGGQQAVYSFRKSLHGYAAGGAIGDSSSAASAAERDAERYLALIARQKKRVADTNAAVRKAEKAYEKAQDASANVYGKGTSEKKHGAVLDTRAAKKAVDEATKLAKSASDKLDEYRSKRSSAQDRAAAASQRGQSLTETSQDFDVANSRGENIDASNPTGVVDYLIGQSRNQDLSKADRAKLSALAGTSNKTLVGLAKKADAANLAVDNMSTNLDTAKSAYQSAAEAYSDTVDPVEKARTALDDATSQYDSFVASITDSTTPYDRAKSALDTATANYQAFVDSITDKTTDFDRAKQGLSDAQSALDDAIRTFVQVKTPVDLASDSLSDATDSASKASSALESVRSAFDGLVSSVASNVRQIFQLGNSATDASSTQTSLAHNAGTGAEWDEMVTTNTPGGATVASIRSEIDQSAASITSFADQLQGLASNGFSSDVINEVEQLGTEKGSQVAAALLTATGDETAAINAGFATIQASSTRAGEVVANATLGAPLAVAQQTAAAADQAVVIAQQQLDAAKQATIDGLTANRDAAQRQYDATKQATLDQLAGAQALAQQQLDVTRQTTLDQLTQAKNDAQRQYDQAKADSLAKLLSDQNDAQRAYDAAAANRDSINGQITAAQTAIVNAISTALTGVAAVQTATATSTASLQDQLNAQYAAIQAGYQSIGKTTKKAYGGIHQPQIASAGRNILWAEGDTGGEAYIPFAMDRRPRALAILDETARRLGRAVVPSGSVAFAQGGITTTNSTSVGGDTHNWNGPIMGSPDEILAAADRRATLKRARSNRSARIGGIVP